MRWGWVWVRRRRLKPLAYAWPSEMPLVVGGRVLVPLGRENRLVMGLVGEAGNGPPPFPELKLIAEVLDETPIYTQKALSFFQWLAFYYMTSMGDVVYLALPGRSGKIADWEIEWLAGAGSPQKSKRTYERLRSLGVYRLRKAARLLDQSPKTLYQTLRRWEKEKLTRLRPIPWRPRPIHHAFVILASEYTSETAFQKLWETLPEKAHPHLLMLLQATLAQKPLTYSAFLRQAGRIAKHLLNKGIAVRVPVRAYYEMLYARPQVPYTLTPPPARGPPKDPHSPGKPESQACAITWHYRQRKNLRVYGSYPPLPSKRHSGIIPLARNSSNQTDAGSASGHLWGGDGGVS